MKKIFTILLLAVMSCQLISAKSAGRADTIKALEEKLSSLQSRQKHTESALRKLTDKQQKSERHLQALGQENARQGKMIDSLQTACKRLAEEQLADRASMNSKLEETNSHVQTNQDMLQSRTLWMLVMAVGLLIIVGVTYRLGKRMKTGDTTIDEVRKAQEALQSAQTKMQEESLRLDDKLLEWFDRQMAATPKGVGLEKPDHSLALKVADELVRIELNMSHMDASIKGYKQLAKAVKRIKDNFKANGYEIIDMLGQTYNEGMKVTANFVADEELEAGLQVITGITKPQVNYDGQMIQAAQITVSQNL